MGNKDVVLITCLMNTIESSGFKLIHFPSAVFLEKTHTLVPSALTNFWGLILCIQTLSQGQSCVSVSQYV